MAGSADDMGGFVLGLVATLNQLETEIIVAKEEKAAIFQDMEIAVSQLENVKEQDKASKQSIAQLKLEIAKLKEANHSDITSGLLASNTVGKASQSLNDLIKIGGLNQARFDMLQAGFKDAFKNSAAEQASRGFADLLRSSAVNSVSHGLLRADLSEVLTNSAKQQARRRSIGSIKPTSIEKVVSETPKNEEDPPL
jgi:DNA-directed RNA polymerase subunit H (RpoH/RPB5)